MQAKVDKTTREVGHDRLSYRCDPSMFKFECTKDLVPLREFIGQERAIRAIDFGMNMPDDGYNVFVSGLSGTGKSSMVKAYIEKLIQTRKDVQIFDWCYVHNFDNAETPFIVSLPPGMGKVLQEKVKQMLDHIRDDLVRAFSSEDYKAQRQKTMDGVLHEQQKIFEQLSNEAREKGFGIQMTPAGPLLIPLVKDRPMEEREFRALRDTARSRLEARQAALRDTLQKTFEATLSIEHETVERLEKADKDMADFIISRLFSPLMSEFGDHPKLARFLGGLKSYTLANLAFFAMPAEQVNPVTGMSVSQLLAAGRNPFSPFEINVFVDNGGTTGPPVVVETNPNFGNMFGKVERRFLFGGYVSDHTMLKAGAMSRAHGGYLLLDAGDLLVNPGVWSAFKRAIKNKEVRIEDPFEQFGLIAPQGLRPEPMPVNVKFVLMGDPELYQTLSMMDEDFWEIFKVKADLNSQIPRSKENMMAYAAFISGCCEQCKARHFDPSGVCRAIEYSLRSVSDQERLSTRFAQIKDLVEEANYWAARDNADTISAKHVRKAIEERLFRHNLVEERIQEAIDRGTIMIDVSGAVVGQVNGLSVYSFGDITFGKPSRITAKTYMGRAGIVDIEREADLSGPVHSKGVMILSGYLGWKYAQEYPLSLSASLCFEQSYEGVEGDSASSAELYATLSSISGVPIEQNMAVTGSVNQKGEIQAIGGVNEKVEGFYATCKAKGLSGDQGVLIPHQNLANLMLRDEVIDAVARGQFHVYAVKTIDQGIEILTGVPAGEKQENGSYPKGSINYLVSRELRRMAEMLKEYGEEDRFNGRRERQTALKKVPRGGRQWRQQGS